MNNQWNKRPDYESEVKKQYGIDINVLHQIINADEYKIKLINGTKEAILHEIMKRGLTHVVILTIGEQVSQFNKYHQAEEKAIESVK